VGKIRWLGHASFEIELTNKVILIDPWLDGNPKAPIRAADVKKADLVCVTHDHTDHLGDAIQICKRTGATFVSVYELSVYAQERGVNDIVGINIGGTVDVKGIRISMVHAFHSSTQGAPTGFIIKAEGKTIYHTGDTGLFGDMKLIKPAVVIPMHYQTFPVLTPSAEGFIQMVKEKIPEVKVIALKPGETYQF